MATQIFNNKGTFVEMYQDYISLMRPLFNIAPAGAKILAHLHSKYNESEGAKEEVRFQWLFSADVKREIKELLDMSDNSFNLQISALKKTQLPNNKGTVLYLNNNLLYINPLLLIDNKEPLVLKFNFIFDESRKEENIRTPKDNSTEEPISEEGISDNAEL